MFVGILKSPLDRCRMT